MPTTKVFTGEETSAILEMVDERHTWTEIGRAHNVHRDTVKKYVERSLRVKKKISPTALQATGPARTSASVTARRPHLNSWDALPAGHPISWDALTAGTWLEGSAYPVKRGV